MNSSDNNDYEDEIFGTLLPDDDEPINKRIAVRYIRSDIKASLSGLGLFGFSKDISVNLLDISSKGAAIEYKKKLTLKSTAILIICFKDSTTFTIKAKIVHKRKNQYGLQFEHFNNELGDHLLLSQNDLKFK